MDFQLSGGELWAVIAWSAVLGGLGGLAFDVLEPLAGRQGPIATDFDNKISLPRLFRDPSTGVVTVDVGFVGPIFVGAVAALVAVFLIAPAPPSGGEALRGVSEISAAREASPRGGGGASSEQTQARLERAEDRLDPRINFASLIPIALLAGFGGPIVLRTARRRVTDLLGAAAAQATEQAKQVGREAVDSDPELNDETRKRLARKVEAQIEGAAPQALRWEPRNRDASG